MRRPGAIEVVERMAVGGRFSHLPTPWAIAHFCPRTQIPRHMSMKQRRPIKLVVVALLIMVGAMIFAFKGREPTYQGKSLTHWLRDLDDELPQEQKEKAQEALASIGVRALPVLDRMLNARESPRERIARWMYNLPFVEPTNF